MHENVVVKQKVDAPVEKVWNALTDKNAMKEWYFDIPDFNSAEHSVFSFYGGTPEEQYHHLCEVVENIPQKKFKHTWSYPEISKEKTLVRWELEPDGEGTMVTLTHKGLENFEHLGKDFQKESFEQGWTELIEQNLKEYVEK